MLYFSGKPYFSLTPPSRRLFSSALALAVVAAAVTLSAPGAEAQGVFWDGPAPVKVKKVKRLPSAVSQEAEPSKVSGKKSKDKDVADRAAVKGPLVINVSLSRQRLTVYSENGPIAESPISSGRVGYSTPTGVFTVLEKKRMHHSNLYAGAPMPNMQRLTWSGIALHAGALPGYPASHGCIRLPQGFSSKLYGMTKSGTRVIVTREPVSPVAIAHDRLFTAFPPDSELVTGSTDTKETRVADASLSGAGSGEGVADVLGVSTAAAAESATPPSLAEPRLSYRERRRLEAEKLNLEIRTAGYQKAEKAILLAQAQKLAAAAREPFLAARSDAERLSGDLAELEQVLANAEKELAELKAPAPVAEEAAGKRKRKSAKVVKKPMDESKRIAKIATLEAKIARLPSEIDATRAASEQADAVFKAAEVVALEAEGKRRAAMNDLADVQAALSRALAKELAAKKLEAKRSLPVSVFVSRAKQRLYIRQGYDDILDVAVTFDRPDEPVGTHVFTALDFTEQKTTMRWSVVSISHDPSRSTSKKKDKSKQPETASKVKNSEQTAAAALNRITIPDDVREQIADVMKPGSSLVISDLSIGNETGEYTDFIVPIR